MAGRFQDRAVAGVRSRHESQIRENAERIREHAGYLIARLDKGRPDSVGLYAEDIAASARRIVTSVAALEVVTELSATYESAETDR